MPPLLSTHSYLSSFFFFFNDTATTEIYTLSLHDALPIFPCVGTPLTSNSLPNLVPSALKTWARTSVACVPPPNRSEEHTSELQSLRHLVCRLLLEKKKNQYASTPL